MPAFVDVTAELVVEAIVVVAVGSILDVHDASPICL